ncbi:MAG TPA: acyltransferase [Chitinophagaceae bacterium]|nr:acyltransferase [Chitinophagaceae bacterium]
MAGLFNTDYILARNRSAWVDYARGICIILVCYRHAYEGLANAEVLQAANYPLVKYLNVFFFSFRMPLFFIVSGIFVGLSLAKKGVFEFVKDRFRYIFYPFLLWGLIQITLQLVFTDYVNADRKPIDYLYLLIMPRKIEQFWYLNALFNVSILYAIIKVKLKANAWHQLGLGLVLYSISAICTLNQVELGFLSDVFFFYPFFAVGDCISHLATNPKKHPFIASRKMFFLLLPVFFATQYLFTSLNLANNNDYFVQHFRPALYALIALTGCVFVLNVSFLLQEFNIARFLRVIGYHSLYIYIMHLMVIAAFRAFYLKVMHGESLILFMTVAVLTGIFIPMIFFNLAEKAGMGWLFVWKKKNAGEEPQAQAPDKSAKVDKRAQPVTL